jgi:hypothetical protein
MREESRLKGDRAGLLGSARNFLLLHDSLVGGFYRDGETKLGGALHSVSYALQLCASLDIPSCGQSRRRR